MLKWWSFLSCVLHLVNWADEKIITTILPYGFNSMGSCTSKVSAKGWILAMQDITKRKVLGTTESPTNWKIRWSKSSDGIQIDNVVINICKFKRRYFH